MPNLNEKALKDRMKKGRIPGVSIAYVDAAGTITPKVVGTTDLNVNDALTPVRPETVFGAASLSKPVFSYLVLKLIAANKVTTPNGKPFDLDTPLVDILPIEAFYKDTLKKEVNPEFAEEAKNITPRMILSHSSGLPIDGSPRFIFKPGTGYEYTGMGLLYLQKAIEKQTGKSLETLAQDEVFQPLGMNHSSFLPPARPHYMAHTESSRAKVKVREQLGTVVSPPIAANSLHTTASDYARFVSAWMNDKDESMQASFIPAVSMTQDRWAKEMGISADDLNHLAWGFGLGLQTDDAGKATIAFHSGDMNQWRAWVAMDLETKSAVVYFANSRHHKEAPGHALADVIVLPEVKLNHALNWFFKKFGYARDLEAGWQKREHANMDRIGQYLSARSTEPVQQESARHYRATLKSIRHNGGSSSVDREERMPEERVSVTPFHTTLKPRDK